MKLTAKGLRKVFPEVFTNDIAGRFHAREVHKESLRSVRKDADDLMDVLNGMLEGHGVEAIRGEWWNNYYGDTYALYINMGDTYNSTVVFDCYKEKFYVTTFGDWVEANSKRYGLY